MKIAADLHSMTGFASTSGTVEGMQVRCEIRSVNGKGLDLRMRLPDAMEPFEQAVKRYAAEKLARGSLQLALSLSAENDAPQVRIDADLFGALAAQAKELASKAGIAPPSTDAILAIRGVVVSDDSASGTKPTQDAMAQIITLGRTAIDELAQARRAEGAVIAKLLAGHLDAIELLVQKCAADPALDGEQVLERLKAQVSRLLGADETGTFESERLHAEAALLATKADVREELDRLNAHIGAARELLTTGGTVGRKFEFLCQELNREANTLCSKSSTTSLTSHGLAMKSVIDQIKEQAANLQ